MLVASYAERPDLAARVGELADVWAEFMHHAGLNRDWHRLREEYPDFQLVLYDDETDTMLGRGQTLPFHWDGAWEDLPDGVDGVFRRVFEEGGGGEPTTLCAIVAVIGPQFQGRGLSRLIIEGMRAAAARHG